MSDRMVVSLCLARRRCLAECVDTFQKAVLRCTACLLVAKINYATVSLGLHRSRHTNVTGKGMLMYMDGHS